jgi:hypothetical protein
MMGANHEHTIVREGMGSEFCIGQMGIDLVRLQIQQTGFKLCKGRLMGINIYLKGKNIYKYIQYKVGNMCGVCA